MTGSRTDREARLKAALRDNLKKRKAQERAAAPDVSQHRAGTWDDETAPNGSDPDGSAPAQR